MHVVRRKLTKQKLPISLAHRRRDVKKAQIVKFERFLPFLKSMDLGVTSRAEAQGNEIDGSNGSPRSLRVPEID